jgi:hypothetical protein
MRIQREARRLDVATSFPRLVLAPLLADVSRRRGDDAIVVIDASERPSLAPGDLSSAMLAIVRRDVLSDALGSSVTALTRRREGHVPLVVIDCYGTTVVFIETDPVINAPGGEG